MKAELILKYLDSVRTLQDRNNDKGITLIELLVVVIIIAILAAVALPNLLGQVGKSREVEAMNAVGTINRQQQAHHYQHGQWSGPLTNANLRSNNVLGVMVGSPYYQFTVAGAPTDAQSTVLAEGINRSGGVDHGTSNGTRDISGMIDFVATQGTYNTIICRADVIGTAGLVPINTSTCPAGHSRVQ